MEFLGSKFERLSYLMGRVKDEIPAKSGIYLWVYWPEIDPAVVTRKVFVDKLLEYTTKQLTYSEDIKGTYKFRGSIHEQGFPVNGNIFGLATKKELQLRDYLKSRKIKRISVHCLRKFVSEGHFISEKQITCRVGSYST